MQQYNILIVANEAVDRRNLAQLLSQVATPACRIQEAPTGAAGLAALRADQFDCVLLDFNLPDMTGLDFLAAAADGGPPCSVVLVTGHGNEVIAVEAMKCGAQDYLVKNLLDANSVWRAVRHAVTQVELQRRLTNSLRDLTASNLALEQEVATRKAAEAELLAAKNSAEQANTAKTRFVAMISHELRTPLNGILGYAELLRLEQGLSPRQDAHVGAMMQAGRHLRELFDRVRDFSVIESGRIELHPAEISIPELVEQCIASMSPLATARGLDLRVIQSHGAPRQIVTDPARLRQVLLNLLGNALKFTDVGSVELRLRAGASPGNLRIEIADTGHGVSDSNRDLLFQDFERLDATSSVEGTGLGLAIAARLVGMMGGKIAYSPNPAGEKPNGGSIFWFELPPGTPSDKAPPIGSGRTAPVLPGQRVLLVDDIMINRDIIGAFLQAAGHIVTLAESGAEAVRLVDGQQFDLVLMDVRMPGMDGLEATRQIRALPGPHGQMPILALTAHTFPHQLERCIEAGMNAHIPKPVDYQTLINAIDRAIQGAGPVDDPLAPPSSVPSTGDQPGSRLDHAVMHRLFALLPRNEITVILQSLRERQQEMLRLLDQGADAAPLTDVAHELTAAAKVFGFVTLAALARDLECALTQNALPAEQLLKDLRAEIVAALPIVDAILQDSRMRPLDPQRAASG